MKRCRGKAVVSVLGIVAMTSLAIASFLLRAPLRSSRFDLQHIYGTLSGLSTRRDGYVDSTSKSAKQVGMNLPKPEIRMSSYSNCSNMLDDVTIGHVTGEGTTFSSEFLSTKHLTSSTNLIPRILHQTWDGLRVPNNTVPWIKSIVSRHPDWEYWFWTQDDIKCFLRHKYPNYVKLYSNYSAMIFKTDVMRYFVLYDIGGIYLDLDVECLQPLDVWTTLSAAILSHETYEQVFLMRQRTKPNVMTTILASRPHHPFYKLLQLNLEKYHKMKPMDVLHSTGPYFLDDIYNLYISLRNLSKSEDDILVLHPKYWLPTYDNLMSMEKLCSSCELLVRNADILQLCAQAKKKAFRNIPDQDSYLKHHWVHTNLLPSTYKTRSLVDITSIVPNFVPVSKRLNLQC